MAAPHWTLSGGKIKLAARKKDRLNRFFDPFMPSFWTFGSAGSRTQKEPGHQELIAFIDDAINADVDVRIRMMVMPI